MKKTVIALLFANLTLVGCGSDDNDNTPVDPVDPVDPPVTETIAIGEAESINIGTPSFEGDTGEMTFTLATDEGVAITGLDTFTMAYVGLMPEKDWTHMADTMGLPAHEAHKFSCDADSCNVTVVEVKEGSYSLTPTGFSWDGSPDRYKALIHISTDKVDNDPMWIE
ncbi:hypothetical protein [Ferrimonas sp. SCSIO 43195]|uniref:hypothetical protein n=1 Tax=Ferrimonas sp. SCSIO 43195 TaxID=2822844 RepID=UPI002075FE6D|nr:hypothetical protein [Ferrimonas sp. SCSIO 43195]USD35698.1 hypothetical protein J8Z22_11610 [Ferrimonas sp. SCSIO 43195]